jgi:NitT/TauT family transport system substrate-binding protein
VRITEIARSILYLPQYIAIARGYAKEQGLDIVLSASGGGDKAGALLLSGAADIALAGPEVPTYIHNGESPEKIKAFCALVGTDGVFLASRKKLDSFRWEMLRDVPILAWRPGSTPELYFEYVLNQNGLDPRKLDLITNIAIPAQAGAWISGKGEFGIFLEPQASELEQKGYLHVVASIGKEVGRADYTMYMATASYIRDNRNVVQGWTTAVAKAQRWMASASPADMAKLAQDYFPSVAPDLMVAAIERYLTYGAPYWADNPTIDRGGIEKAQEIFVAGGVLPADKRVDYSDIVLTEFSEAAIEALK